MLPGYAKKEVTGVISNHSESLKQFLYSRIVVSNPKYNASEIRA